MLTQTLAGVMFLITAALLVCYSLFLYHLVIELRKTRVTHYVWLRVKGRKSLELIRTRSYLYAYGYAAILKRLLAASDEQELTLCVRSYTTEAN